MTDRIERVSDLSPNMRKVLREYKNEPIKRRDTYWITLQGLVFRGLARQIDRQTYDLTTQGRELKASLAALRETEK